MVPLLLPLLPLLPTRNVLLRDSGDLCSVVLIDFGLSRCLPDAAGQAQSTTDTCADEGQRRTIQAMACSPRCGTVQYMSPEMLTMNCSETSTSSSATMSMSASEMQAVDVWSLGVVLYVRQFDFQNARMLHPWNKNATATCCLPTANADGAFWMDYATGRYS